MHEDSRQPAHNTRGLGGFRVAVLLIVLILSIAFGLLPGPVGWHMLGQGAG